ncbi:MAG: imidazole glycerol phosphate synthase subunit HisH [Aestuariivirgaceae bacterium]|jgi:imidazole glycerol-phosphate synthase subunit HisH
MTVAIVDYGSGNLRSASKALERAAVALDTRSDIIVTADPDAVRKAERIVLPGVGAFRDCRDGIAAIPGMMEALDGAVRRDGKPFLGICVGMQLMATSGHEHVVTPGFGWIAGEVHRLAPSNRSLKIPHIGWNALAGQGAHPLLDGLDIAAGGQHAYFVHSYALLPADPADILLTTDYGGAITAMVMRDNLAGTQFHPEKSQAFGLGLLANFLRWRP